MGEGKGNWEGQVGEEAEGHWGNPQGEESGHNPELVANMTDFETALVSEMKVQSQGLGYLRKLEMMHLL